MTPEQSQVVETVFEDYRTCLRPLLETYSVIATRFGRPANVPEVVNNEIRNSFDHLDLALSNGEPGKVAENGRQALWHMLIARCDLLRLSCDIVASALEATLRQVAGEGGTLDPRMVAAMDECAVQESALHADIGRSRHPLPIDDPSGNHRKMQALNRLLALYLTVYRDSEALGLASAGPRPRTVVPFSDEQARAAANLHALYDAWMDIERQLPAMPHSMSWQADGVSEQLWRQDAASSPAVLLGPRSPESEATFADYTRQKAELMGRRADTGRRLEEVCGLYLQLHMPTMPGEAAAILREFDRRSLLGTQLLVIGTNAMSAYVIEAGGFLSDASDETQDFDLAWTGTERLADEALVWPALKAVDSSYTVNSERRFQARNRAGYEVELLAAPSRAGSMPPQDQPRPMESDTQEWLLNGRQVARVVVARDGSPARIVAPDPRWFALHKLWLSAQETRNPLKRDKDSRQGTSLLNAIEEVMPQYHLDAAFQASLPEPLATVFRVWRSTRAAGRRPPDWLA